MEAVHGARKATSGAKVIEWVNAGDYAAVEDYIRNEAAAFIELYQYLLKTMPGTWQAFAKETGLATDE